MSLITILLNLILFTAAYEPRQLPADTVSFVSLPYSDTVNLESLLALDKQKFIGASVAAFMNSPEAKGYTTVSFRERDHKLESIRLKYADDLYLQLNLRSHAALVTKEGQGWTTAQVQDMLIDDIGVIYVMHDK